MPRYYSELEKLHDQLVSTLDDVLIPALPLCPSPRLDKEGELVGRQWWFTIRLPNEETVFEGDTGVVENKIQLWLDRIADHERAKNSEGLREFVESEVGVGKMLLVRRETSKFDFQYKSLCSFDRKFVMQKLSR